jgi:biopolymer transport protein ExbB/TolQ
MAALARNLSEAIVPSALGLLVAVPALAYQCLRRQAEVFDVEMENASLELVSRLCSRR